MAPVVAPSLTKDALVSAMTGQLTTDKWDVVCSYSADAINALLSARHTGGHLVGAFTLTTTHTDDFTKKTYDDTFTVSLAAPTISFPDDTPGWCELAMPIASGTWSSVPQGGGDTVTGTFDTTGGLTITGAIPLGALQGSTGEAAPTGAVVELADPGTPASVVLHFKTLGAHDVWSVTPATMKDEMVTLFASSLPVYFKTSVNEIDYALSSVLGAPAAAPSPTGVILKPVAFAFATGGGILSLYIQTSNSGNGPGVTTNPTFPIPGGPIPAGYSASVIFGQDAFEKGYLTPQAPAGGSVSFDTSDPAGLTVDVKVPGAFSYDASYGSSMSMERLQTDAFNVDFMTTPHVLKFSGNQVTVSFTYNQNLNWHYTNAADEGPDGDANGVANVAVTMSKSFPLPAPGPTGVSVAITVAGADYSATSTSVQGGGLTGGMDMGPAVAGQFNATHLPDLTFDFGTLNYFATTNLLFPGTTVLTVDPAAGLNVPADVVLFGNVVTS